MTVSGVFFVLGIYLLSTLTMGTPCTLVTMFMVLAGLELDSPSPVLSMASIHKLKISSIAVLLHPRTHSSVHLE